MHNIIELAEDLLATWMDRLIELQLKDVDFDGLNGGILCPACSRIHGRSLDAIYPFMYRAQISGDERYLEAARSLFRWSSKVSFSDGAWENDVVISRWRGITVFGTISLAETLKFHGNLLAPEEYKEWLDRLSHAAHYLYENIHIDTSVINYPITAVYAFELVSEILSDSRFSKKAQQLCSQCLKYFTDGNRFIYGEGHARVIPSKKGCYPIDLGYNIEESIPALTLYALMVNDIELLKRVIGTINSHLDFMLPDGAWDNSWGSRCYKWTYWGSRTTDGSLPALGLLGRIQPEFLDPALKNLRLLAQYTRNGLLSGHDPYTNIEPCVHHTISHGKGLALFLNHYREEWREPPPATLFYQSSNLTGDTECTSNKEFPAYFENSLQAAKKDKVTFYPEIQAYIIRRSSWRSTITGYDQSFDEEQINSGNGMTLLWHELAGPLVTASLRKYKLVEPHNMQVTFDVEDHLLTPRVECLYNDISYSSINDYTASIAYFNEEYAFKLRMQCRLVNAFQYGPVGNELHCTVDYIFTDKDVQIVVYPEPSEDEITYKLVLPIISPNNETVKILDHSTAEITKNKCTVSVNTNGTLLLPESGTTRIFNFVPGFEAVEFQVLSDQNDKKISATIYCNA